ncbi:BatA domain-containing protein [Thermomonas sp.]|uniref:BatA domain-containing protein n=1 Tax=Thermomonas sp. TaxID=1971895 RepID=UPI0024891DEA|nr:BatA domain-containing protein [Thermomonas sp.]MDI1253211.1 BatA domain-containing protein [Thermomonas sp.]
MNLLLPSALIALLALAIPLLVHLVRQTQQKRIEFAALRWLVARAQPRRRPRFNEWLLLALRLLLLAMLALWLAQPVLRGHPDLRPWVVVDPDIDAAHMPARTSKDAQWHWLAPGFPSIDKPAPPTSASIASLLRELDATLPKDVSLTAIVPEQFDATDAQRPRLERAVTWAPVPGTSAFSASAARKSMRIAAFVDAEHQAALPYLRAAATAWSSQTKPQAPTNSLRAIPDAAALHPDDTHLLWLANTTVPAQQQQWVRDGGTILLAQDSPAASLDWQTAQVTWRSADGAPLALRMSDGKGAWVRMLVPFTPQSLPALLEPDFPVVFQDALQANPPIATRAWANTYSPVVDAQAVHAIQSPRPLGGLLALLIALLFGIERLVAMSMRRFRSA